MTDLHSTRTDRRLGTAFWVQVGIFVVVVAVVMGLFCEPHYPTVQNSAGETFEVFEDARIITTGGHWTVFKYLSHGTRMAQIGPEQATLLREVAGTMADWNGDTLLEIQAVHARLHFGALVDFRVAYTFRYAKEKGEWINVRDF